MAKNAFSSGLLDSIRSTTSSGVGKPMELAIDQLQPDPEQPRKQIDQESLEALAASIRRYGVLQPVTVRRAGEGKWWIKFGERRWRAAQIVGLKTIPALEAPAGDQLETQLVENQHRQGLANTDLARAIGQLTARKIENEEISMVVNIPVHQLKLYRSILKLPDDLLPWADRLDVRTVYELQLAWSKATEQGRGLIRNRLLKLEDGGSLTLADARRLITSLGTSVPSVQNHWSDRDESGGTLEDVVVQPRRKPGDPAWLVELIVGLVGDINAAADALESSDPSRAGELRERARQAKEAIDGWQIKASQ